MKFSFFTPTHRPQFLKQVYNSILRQGTQHTWEWVIIPNGGVKAKDVPLDVSKDNKRVRIIESDLKGIGALKRFACEQCRGDIFIELDHDDVVAPELLEELTKAAAQTPDGFYYSDFVNVKPDGTCEVYGTRFGWESYNCKVHKSELTACRAFPPTARAMCQIFYAPNHVRAWSRKGYELSGGHDPDLAVGDDHELLCRTYLAGVPFHWIEKPLYVYRRYKGNSFVEFNAEIQTQQLANMNKYLHSLIYEECRRNDWSKLDLGRETDCPDDFSSYDLVGAGLPEKIPAEDNSIGVVRTYDVWQRIPRQDIVRIMNEIYRVLRPGGWLLTATPSIDDGAGKPGRGVFQDPTHCSYWSENNWWYFTDKKFAGLVSEFKGRFQNVRLWTAYPTDWHEQHCIPYVYSDLCALKGQRQPGKCTI